MADDTTVMDSSSSSSSDEHIHPDILEGLSHDMLYRFVVIVLLHALGFGLYALYRKRYPLHIPRPEQHKLFEYNDPRLNQPPTKPSMIDGAEGKSTGVQFSEGAALRRR